MPVTDGFGCAFRSLLAGNNVYEGQGVKYSATNLPVCIAGSVYFVSPPFSLRRLCSCHRIVSQDAVEGVVLRGRLRY